FLFNDTPTSEIYTLSLHDALPIWIWRRCSTWRSSDATRRILNPSARHRPISPASCANRPPNRGTACVSSVTSTASGSAPTCALRSEEHTSELQSRENLVCRLLLEK